MEKDMFVLDKKIKKCIECGQSVKMTHDVGNNQYVEIKISKKSGGYEAKVTLFSKVPQKKLGHPARKTFSDLSTAGFQIRALCLKLKGECMENKTHKTKDNRLTKDEFQKMVRSVPGLLDPEEWGNRKRGGRLAVSTIEDAVNGLIGTYNRIMDRFGKYDVSDEELILFKNEEVERIFAQNNGHAKSGVSKVEILNNLHSRWNYINEAISICKRNMPDGDWPSIELPVGISTRVAHPELLKVITYERYIKVAVLLIRLCREGVQEAYAALAEVFCGARVGESTAFQLRKFEIVGEYGRYYIDEQIDSKGKLTAKLKNEQSYRYVFLNGIMLDLYKLKIQQLRKQGINEDRIIDAFIGSSYESPFIPLRKEMVSAFLKKMLETVGVTKEEVAVFQEVASTEIGDDSDNDVCAHLFRRIYATYTTNGGIPANEVDRILGHENLDNKGKDYAGWDKAIIMTDKLNRCFNFGPLTKKQGNPRFVAEQIKMNEIVQMDGNLGYHFEIKEKGNIKMELETVECEDEIRITVNGQNVKVNADQKFLPDNDADRNGRNIYPHLPDSETVDKWIKEANAINLSEFLKRKIRHECIE